MERIHKSKEQKTIKNDPAADRKWAQKNCREKKNKSMDEFKAD